MVRGFCHLNLHSDRSQFLGLVKPGELVDWAAKYGVGAVAITDHDNMCVAVELYKLCKARNIKPIYGMEVSICFDKTKRDRGVKNLVLLVKNPTGFKNLITLATIGGMYFYYRPRIDFDDLRKYGKGLIALTACLNGLTAHKFFVSGKDGLYSEFMELHSIFDDDLYLEVQPSSTKDTQRIYNEACRQVAEEHDDVKLVATGDPHYFAKEDSWFHEQFMRIRYGVAKYGDWEYPFHGWYHVRTREEMDDAFSDLHGYDVNMVPVFKDALEAPDKIIEGIESFDISKGIKMPEYIK